MEFVELVNERLASLEGERKQLAQAAELRRLGITSPFSPRAHVDGLLIRASKGAFERQARRDYEGGRRGFAS
jgi:hypothetical protein